VTLWRPSGDVRERSRGIRWTRAGQQGRQRDGGHHAPRWWPHQRRVLSTAAGALRQHQGGPGHKTDVSESLVFQGSGVHGNAVGRHSAPRRLRGPCRGDAEAELPGLEWW